MVITNELSITKEKATGNLNILYNGITVDYLTNKDMWDFIYSNCLHTCDKEGALNICLSIRNTTIENLTNPTTEGSDTPTLSTEEILKRGLTALINFFTEFDFEPNFRFVNTLAYKIAQNQASAKDYINNYFALMDNSYCNEISAKMKSKEFNNILADIKKGGLPQNTVNTRLKIYYGSAGTGKTTMAMKETDNRCIICNSSMLPSDLMEDFIFVDGKATFTPSKLWRCMEEGKSIVLDEINLLPFDSLRFLQGILDGKTEFDYKGNKVVIKEGFQIIGTMNLSIGGMTYGLPEPLVDRSSDLQKFTLTADMLEKAILG